MELMRDGMLNSLGQFRILHHLADKIAITFLGRDTSRGGVRLAQIAHLGQRGHLISDGGGRHAEMIMLSQPLRANRLSSIDIIA